MAEAYSSTARRRRSIAFYFDVVCYTKLASERAYIVVLSHHSGPEVLFQDLRRDEIRG